jgi:GT2 family glycosyltransferase
MPDDLPLVSIVIVSYNSRSHLPRCLASICRHEQLTPYEVIVVDNASSDGTAEEIERSFPDVRLVRRSRNAGFAAGVNEGIRAARGEFFLLLNPDAELTQPILEPMVDYLRGHADAGLLAPKLLDASGTLQLSCRAFPGFATGIFNRYSLLTRLLPANPLSRSYLMTGFDHVSIADVDWVSGACWMLPRSKYERVGPLDEAYFWSVEDVDYCHRIHDAALRVVYFPRVSLRHSIGGSSTSAPVRATLARHRGMFRYYRRYLRPRRPIVRQLMDAAVLSGISVRCVLQVAGVAARRAVTRRR